MIRIERKEITTLADNAVKQNDVRKAMEIMKKAKENYYFDMMNFLLGFIEQCKNNHESAITFYKSALDISPNYKGVYNQIANCYTALGKYDEAIKWYNEYIKLFSSQSTAIPLYNRALTQTRKGELEVAISDCLASIEQDKTYKKPYALLLNILFKLKRTKKALKVVDEILTVFAEDDDKFAGLSSRLINEGATLEAQGEKEKANTCYEKAQNVLEKGLVHLPDNSSLHFNMACYYSRRGQQDLAIKELKKSIELDPKQKEMAVIDKDFKPLRDTKEFKEVIA